MKAQWKAQWGRDSHNTCGVRHMNCCGMREITQLSYASDAKQALLRFWDHHDIQAAFVVFSGVERYGYAQEFAAFLKKHGLGQVVRTTLPAKNPNTRNILVAYLWRPNWKRIAAFVRAEERK